MVPFEMQKLMFPCLADRKGDLHPRLTGKKTVVPVFAEVKRGLRRSQHIPFKASWAFGIRWIGNVHITSHHSKQLIVVLKGSRWAAKNNNRGNDGSFKNSSMH